VGRGFAAGQTKLRAGGRLADSRRRAQLMKLPVPLDDRAEPDRVSDPVHPATFPLSGATQACDSLFCLKGLSRFYRHAEVSYE